MKSFDLNKQIIQSYLELLKNLSPESKLELIEQLSKSIKSTLQQEEKSKDSLFGAFDSKKPADQILLEIRNSRNSNRQIESF